MSKKIPLTKGKSAIVDNNDYDILAKYSWYSNESSTTPYAYRSRWISGENRSVEIPMHHVVMNCVGRGEEVDHINGNGLDNRKENLRFVTRAQNNWNQKPRNCTSSRYKGVSWNKRREYWESYIQVNNRKHHLGSYQNEEMAALAYDLSALCMRGEYARVNNVNP